MTFTVTYRCADGALREVTLEAANRAVCFAQCKARGIAPVSVKEGLSDKRVASSTVQEQPKERAKRKLFTIHFYLIVVTTAIVVIAWFLSRPQIKPPDDPPKNAKPVREAKPKQQSKPVAIAATNVPATAVATNTPPSSAGDPYGGEWRGQKIVSYSIKTNGWSTYEHIVTADGKTHGVIGTTVKPIFDNGSDQMLAMAVRASHDSETPPMPLSPLLESDFLESLKKPIVIKEDDSEEVKQLKRDVMQAREDMMDMMNKGMTVQQALEEHFKIANENVGIRNKAVAELRSILESGDEEGAAKYMEAVNATLEKMGIMKLELPAPRVRGRSKEAAGQKQF